MSRLSRLKEYENPLHGPQGAACYESNIKVWSQRASDNSKIAGRASDGPMKLPSTGRKVETRDTTMSPKVSRNVDAMMRGRDDLNHVGDSDYLASIRRKA